VPRPTRATANATPLSAPLSSACHSNAGPASGQRRRRGSHSTGTTAGGTSAVGDAETVAERVTLASMLAVRSAEGPDRETECVGLNAAESVIGAVQVAERAAALWDSRPERDTVAVRDGVLGDSLADGETGLDGLGERERDADGEAVRDPATTVPDGVSDGLRATDAGDDEAVPESLALAVGVAEGLLLLERGAEKLDVSEMRFSQ
jgi:hypothetical protein